MKKGLLMLLGTSMLAVTLNAQTKSYYTPSVGILGGANYAHFRVDDKAAGASHDWKWDWAAGAYFNLPITKTFSVEPQVLYSRMGGTGSYVIPGGHSKYDIRSEYLSVPVLFKFNIGRHFDVFAGPQFDCLLAAKELNSKTNIKDNTENMDIAGTAGFELFPRSRFTFYARYIHGFKEVAETRYNNEKWYNEGIQAGLKLRLFGGKLKTNKVAVVVPPVVVVDTDGDGVPDSEDKCPTVPGLAKYNGCPVPDTDGDGINDENDKCPTVPGVAKYQGCPIPDTDGDGINDEEDKCPTIPGTRANNGCPEVKQEVKKKVELAARQIFFATGSDKLLAKSFTGLNQVAEVLKDDSSLRLDIQGHTDNTGSAQLNQTLSEKRAASVLKYLESKGVPADRMTSQGFGPTQPIGDNKTAVGRAANRRVEMLLHY